MYLDTKRRDIVIRPAHPPLVMSFLTALTEINSIYRSGMIHTTERRMPYPMDSRIKTADKVLRCV